MVFNFTLPAPRIKRLCRCQTPDNIVAIVIVASVVVTAAIVAISILGTFTLDLFP